MMNCVAKEWREVEACLCVLKEQGKEKRRPKKQAMKGLRGLARWGSGTQKTWEGM